MTNHTPSSGRQISVLATIVLVVIAGTLAFMGMAYFVVSLLNGGSNYLAPLVCLVIQGLCLLAALWIKAYTRRD